MILKKLSILNYKNIAEAELELSPKMNCLVGNNGEGKTNLLDAVYYLSFCRSAGTNIDSHVIRHGEDFFMLQGIYERENGNEEQVYCGMKRGTKKHFKRNKKEYRKLSEHIGLLPLIMISPSDTILIDGGSEERRRLMDVVISQYDSNYLESLNRYGKALMQRNSLLKLEVEPDAALLDIWEEQMAREGELLYDKRKDFIESMSPVFRHIYQRISEGKEQVSLHYVSHCQRGSLIDVIRRDRQKDRIMGYSLHGVHRDDIEMMIGDYLIKREGSQGQSKTFVTALKLAQLLFLKNKVGTAPMLLLDDIFDKLDAGRVEQIIRLVGTEDFGQIFITDTNRSHIDKILESSGTDYCLFKVENGKIEN
ncbi:DNA replication/repair protein RecF [Prevotella sp. OH937_COT-195]|uniref:DNA replication/repair protein RecF n=1 Tax=Prevotella sp. OH937_COT-195 TaxID=2491051 RepID=UPI000F64A4E7|nr:DNA replication/repair protein RecF [Prevotella sp. OH937_COT-195]RRD03011.1 DNA replication/repair protein RecF [Prevotella sp. OH937_COT-195]